MLCEEKKWDYFDVDTYRSFIRYLTANEIKMQKFPLCIKESGGMYERGRDKTKFLEELSHISAEDASAYTIKLSTETLSLLRSFKKPDLNVKNR
jgi:hypothetical protein